MANIPTSNIPLVNLNGMEQLAQSIRNDAIVFPATHTRGENGIHHLICQPEAKMIRFRTTDDFYCRDRVWKVNDTEVILRYSDGSRVSPGTVVSGELYMGELMDGSLVLTAAPPKNNDNILINSHFSDPINQKLQTEYGPYQYGIDQWWVRGDQDAPVTCSIVNGAIQLKRTEEVEKPVSLNQRIEKHRRFVGKEVTGSILVRNNNNQQDIHFGFVSAANVSLNSGPIPEIMAWIPAGEDGMFSFHGIVPDLGTNDVGINFTCCNYAKDHVTDYEIIAAKLELGNKQTLAHLDETGNWVENEPIFNYEQELAKCQRYMYVPTLDAAWGVIGSGPASNNYAGGVMVATPVPMIDILNGSIWSTGNIQLNDSMHILDDAAAGYSIKSISLDPKSTSKNGVWVSFQTNETSLVAGNIYHLRAYNDPTAMFVIQSPTNYA